MWSKEKPTVPGWYWWKDPAFVLSGKEKVMQLEWNDIQGDWGDTCEWSGPIAPPDQAPLTPGEE